MRRIVVTSLTLALAGALLPAPAGAGTAFRSGPGTWADFNGDGHADLFAGAVFDVVGGNDFAGAANVIYGRRGGITPRGNQWWHQNRPGVKGAAASGDEFAWSIAGGDFDGDGRDDLAVGIYGETVNGVDGAGAVQVFYGSPRGLRAKGNQLWHQDRPGIAEKAEPSDHFGMRVAAGDLDGDGRDELLVGVPYEQVNGMVGAGAVHVIRGGPNGLRSQGDQLWHQGRPGVNGDPGGNDFFGFELAVGDFGKGPGLDLAVGAPGEDTAGQNASGAVHLLYSGPDGLRPRGDRVFSLASPNVPGDPMLGDFFGMTMAAGNFGKGGRDDLAIGVIAADVGGANGAGVVVVLHGSGGGLRTQGVQVWHQDRPGIADAAETGDQFGWMLAAGDMGKSGHDDLAIGVPFEVLSGFGAAGAVHVVFGSKGGLRARGDQYWHQDRGGVKETVEASDFFGMYLMSGDFGRGPKMDLAISAPGETLNGINFAGAVHVLYSKRNGPAKRGNQLWHQDRPRIKGAVSLGDHFGVLTRFID